MKPGEMNAKLESAKSRDEKKAVLEEYMSESMAHEFLGRMLGEHEGDIVDLSKKNKK